MINADNIPQELCTRPQWVVWHGDKIPRKLDGSPASTTDPATWTTFETAIATVREGRFGGVGFVFTADDPYFGIDLDHCRQDDGTLTPEASRVIADMGSYTEASPSGHGVHIIAKGRIPQGANKRGNYEIYEKARYFTVTGCMIGANSAVNERTTQAAAFHAEFIAPITPGLTEQQKTIPEGTRNSTLSHRAGQLLKRYGDTEQARDVFDREAMKCQPPLDGRELDTIYRSAQSFFHRALESADGYIPPEQYSAAASAQNLKPSDFTDVGEALILAREYGNGLRHSTATNFLVYSGKVWEENAARARGCLHDLTQRQLDEHMPVLCAAVQAVDAAKKDGNKAAIERTEQELKAAMDYQRFILKCRDSKTISGVMKEGQTPLEIDAGELDKHAYLLNTPDGEADLRTGKLLPHWPEHFHTKMAAVAPSSEGAELWRDCLSLATCGDNALAEYLQLLAGQTAVGKVLSENLIIAYGSGRNGKSTVFNTIARVLGDYAGQISAETLTTGRKNGKNWELAELRGKRLIIAPELEEGTRLDASFVKKICSTDKILGEQKYKAPFTFEPSHTVILFTNHLPKIGSNDAGTWRRLIVVPFNAVIEGKDDRKNYADHLFRHAGGAVLSWIIEGARKFVEAKGKIEPPEPVMRAIEQYRTENDWLNNFLLECCEIGKTFVTKSGELYSAYREYCARTGEYTRSAQDFKAAIEGVGYETRRVAQGVFVHGLRVVSEYPMPL